MGQNVPLAYGDAAIEPFFDATQEMLSAAAPSLALTVTADGTIQATAGVDDAEQTVAIQHRYRYLTTNAGGKGQAAHPAGAAGTYNIWATAADNDFSGAGAGLDLTNYDFALEVRAVGDDPIAPALKRKVGETQWDGSKIIGIRQLAGARRDDAPLSPTAPWPTVTPLRVRSAASQVSPLAVFQDSAGAAKATLTAAGALTLAGGLDAGPSVEADAYTIGGAALSSSALSDSPNIPKKNAANTFTQPQTIDQTAGLFITGAGGHTMQVYSGAAPGLVMDGDTNLYRQAADILRTDDALVVLGTLTAAGAFAANGNLAHGSGGNLGFYGVTPIARPAALTNSSGLTAARTLPNHWTMEDLARWVIAVVSDLKLLGLEQ